MIDTQGKGIGRDYMAHILSQPCLNPQLDKVAGASSILKNFLMETEDFQQRQRGYLECIKAFCGTTQVLTNKGAVGVICSSWELYM